MKEIIGTVVVVQEGRMQVMSPEGDGHLLILGAAAAAETGQLRELQRGQARVRVTCSEIPNLVALKAEAIEILNEERAT